MTSLVKDVLYLAQPYSGTPDQMKFRADAAVEAVARLHNRGMLVYSPIAHFHASAVYLNLPTAADFYLEHNLTMLERCDNLGILKLPGWEASKGVNEEIQYAKDCGMAGYFEVTWPKLHVYYKEFDNE